MKPQVKEKCIEVTKDLLSLTRNVFSHVLQVKYSSINDLIPNLNPIQ